MPMFMCPFVHFRLVLEYEMTPLQTATVTFGSYDLTPELRQIKSVVQSDC